MLSVGLILALHQVRAAPAPGGATLLPSAEAAIPAQAHFWTVDNQAEFAQGVLDRVALEPAGTARLDQLWMPDGRVSDANVTDSRFSPRAVWYEADSRWLVVWADERQADHSPDIFLASSADNGLTWSADILVHDNCDPNESPFPECPDHYNPDLAVRAADDTLWVVWHQVEPGTGADEGNIYYAWSQDGGDTWPEDQVGVVTDGPGRQHWPRLATVDGTLYAIWEDEAGDAGDIVIARFNPDTDSTWSSPIPVSEGPAGTEQYGPALAADADGNLYAIWTDNRANTESYGHVFFSRWLAGSTWAAGSWSPAVQLSDEAMDWAIASDVAVAPDGSIYVAWAERVPTGPATYDFQVVVARSGDQGVTWNSTVVHRLVNPGLGFYQGPSLGVAAPDRILVAWLHSPDSQVATSDVLVATSYDQGQHWSLPRRINSQSTVDVDSLPSLAVNEAGRAVVAWQDFRTGSGPQIYATAYPGNRYAPQGSYMGMATPGTAVVWQTLSWTATVPAGTALRLATRAQINDVAGWTPWEFHSSSPAALTYPPAEALQVRAFFSSTLGLDTPVLDSIQVSYETMEATSTEIFLPLVTRGP
ncbi:hypothetical protein RY27_22560 [Litorilinea aerophila]|nr:hypothetical protein RY27_22560 [Litorilinea aerophila]